jgi:hypothetical protein
LDSSFLGGRIWGGGDVFVYGGCDLLGTVRFAGAGQTRDDDELDAIAVNGKFYYDARKWYGLTGMLDLVERKQRLHCKTILRRWGWVEGKSRFRLMSQHWALFSPFGKSTILDIVAVDKFPRVRDGTVVEGPCQVSVSSTLSYLSTFRKVHEFQEIHRYQTLLALDLHEMHIIVASPKLWSLLSSLNPVTIPGKFQGLSHGWLWSVQYKMSLWKIEAMSWVNVPGFLWWSLTIWLTEAMSVW